MVSAQTQLVGVTHYGDQVLLAVAETGDWFSQDFQQPSWALRGNIFVSSGSSGNTDVVAFENLDWNGNRPTVLTTNGAWFQMNVTNSGWDKMGNVGTDSGHSPNGAFIDMGVYGATLVAITVNGDWYEKTPLSAWGFVANIFETSGVVGTESQDIGSLKSMFR